MFEGIRCDDVQAKLLHLSLAGTPPGPDRDKLLAIPTGLTIARDDVDRLIAAGHDSVTNSAELKAFLADYPPQPVAPPTRTTAARRSAQR